MNKRMGSMALVFYSVSLLLVITNLHLSPLLITCSSISSLSSLTNNNKNRSSISPMLCHPEESYALISFKNSMNTSYNKDIQSWKKGTDCCGWDGVTCHPTSHHVVGLGLSDLVGALHSNSTLFQLRHLRSLTMKDNDFCGSHISPMFGSSFPHLEKLDLSYSNFSGEVPLEISQLSKLNYLDLEAGDWIIHDKPTIRIVSMKMSTTRIVGLVSMKMSTFYNIISNMTQLSYLSLDGVNINSTIPLSFTNLSSLEFLYLRDCNLRGELSNILNMPSLNGIYLRGNHDLNANFPPSNWSTSLAQIDLSSINFSSTLPSSSLLQPQLIYLALSGCNLHGPIPNWVWNVSFANDYIGLLTLDLSDNKLTGTLTNLSWNYLLFLDLSYNMFDGPLPDPPTRIIQYSASNNNFTWPLPLSLCNLTTLQILDLSNNNLKDELPHCFVNTNPYLIVLNLGSNNIYGSLSETIFSNCSNLELLDLSVNWLEGLLPRSLDQCTNLEVLNLKNNKFRDEFPYWLGSYSLPIQVLDLSWNFFFGSTKAPLKFACPFPRLQVLDLSHNNFSGKISAWFIEEFEAMVNVTQIVSGRPEYLQPHSGISQGSYFYSITLTFNNVDRKYEKIITTLALLDLSNNKFEGEIPSNIGKLVSLYGLNLSHNQLVGPIPPSLGNLTLLNFLDLSSNNLTGQIPQEPTSLTSLGVFNVSENQLTGPIPHGENFDTFLEDSYNGNLGLCGFPLPDCGGHVKPRPQPSKNDNEDDVGMMSEWKVVVMGCGFGTFVSFVWGCYMLSIGRPLWLSNLF